MVAETALAQAEVTPAALKVATSLLDLSMNEFERLQRSSVDFESEVYMLTVTLYVKNELKAAGYPDADRVMEVGQSAAARSGHGSSTR